MVDDGLIAFADVDGDNDPDLLITGSNSITGTSLLYINERILVFASGINTAEVPENTINLLTVKANHANASAVITYSVSGGADGALFTIDGTSRCINVYHCPGL